jgi:hypothetical protein
LYQPEATGEQSSNTTVLGDNSMKKLIWAVMAAAALTTTGFAQGTTYDYSGPGKNLNDAIMDNDFFTTGPGLTSFSINVTDTATIQNFNFVSLKNLTSSLNLSTFRVVSLSCFCPILVAPVTLVVHTTSTISR